MGVLPKIGRLTIYGGLGELTGMGKTDKIINVGIHVKWYFNRPEQKQQTN